MKLLNVFRNQMCVFMPDFYYVEFFSCKCSFVTVDCQLRLETF